MDSNYDSNADTNEAKDEDFDPNAFAESDDHATNVDATPSARTSRKAKYVESVLT